MGNELERDKVDSALKNVEFGELLDIYGELLPQNQFDLIDLYCNQDLSLAEISENEGITRQGVHDKIKRGQQQLLEYEQKLGLVAKQVILQNIIKKLQKLNKTEETEKIIADVEQLLN